MSGSEDKTIRLWSAVKMQPSPESTEPDLSAFSLHRSIIPATEENHIMPTNTGNDRLIRFSSSLEHVLPNPADLLKPTPHHNFDSTPFLLQVDGWVMGPNRRLLFWVPPASRYAFYNPWASLVIPRGGVELDLSHMVHGTNWSSCRDVLSKISIASLQNSPSTFWVRKDSSHMLPRTKTIAPSTSPGNAENRHKRRLLSIRVHERDRTVGIKTKELKWERSVACWGILYTWAWLKKVKSRESDLRPVVIERRSLSVGRTFGFCVCPCREGFVPEGVLGVPLNQAAGLTWITDRP
ncbi:uncharacterized protein EDB93DRAFT_1334526 [Suillus bovinus]|uniref:uncharacterized protein n=1 Tax=Suillus bovinus TaxID=48563 RepID=UPI001B865C8E|nr:uncharacterized protein EDB93DRAFT_1334526 [Suillus bovinus]KAG2158587.1 hypothetical protein EDB93DRAFT_1334526 [Suillus bovinus]